MTVDAWLAIGHHVAVFGLLTVLATEWGIVRPGIAAAEIRRLGRVDIAYGVFAGAVVIAGMARLEAGPTDFSYYGSNPFYWLKMGTFATVGLLSIGPTRRFMRWRKALRVDDSATPGIDEVRAVRCHITVQLALFPLIPVFAALMARGIGR